MNFAKMFLAALLAHVFLALMGFGLVMLVAAGLSADDAPEVTESSWLVFDIYGSVPPYHGPASIESKIFGDDAVTVHDILGNLEKAAVDDRIEGVIFKVSSNNGLGRASTDEIREGIKAVQSAGKRVYAWSDDLDRSSLHLAAACDSIIMAPAGELSLFGMYFLREFYRGTLDKLGIKPQIHRIKDYKTAAEAVLRKDMSPEAEEMANWMLNEFWDMQIADIAAGRKTTVDAIAKHMEYALFTATEARDAGLIDGVMYWNEFTSYLKGDADELATTAADKYADVSRASVGIKGKKRIAVVHAWGTIGGRRANVDPMMGTMIGHESTVEALREAADDDKIEAIVFRVDSPGGESLASMIIANEVGRIRSEKPIIVSMGDVAASGGYAISYKATKIVADRLTVTGSIGSISGKMNMRGLYEKLGFSFDWISKGANANMYSPVNDFSPQQWDRFVENHYHGFDEWLNDIAAERGMSVEDLTKLAHGRVWTGRQARENGLVDEVGGLKRAIELAMEAAGIAGDEAVTLIDYPKKQTFMEMLRSQGGPFAFVRMVVATEFRAQLKASLDMTTRSQLWMWTGEFN